jgi:hypothetical protein
MEFSISESASQHVSGSRSPCPTLPPAAETNIKTKPTVTPKVPVKSSETYGAAAGRPPNYVQHQGHANGKHGRRNKDLIKEQPHVTHTHKARRLVPRQARPTPEPRSTIYRCRTRFSEGGRVSRPHPQAQAHKARRLVPRPARPAPGAPSNHTHLLIIPDQEHLLIKMPPTYKYSL